MQVMNFKVTAELRKAIWKEAKKVPYRTVSQYLREVVEASIRAARTGSGK